MCTIVYITRLCKVVAQAGAGDGAPMVVVRRSGVTCSTSTRIGSICVGSAGW
jgi:hypothetical protein